MLNRSFFGYKPGWIKYLSGLPDWIRIGPDYSMKILDWIGIAKISDLFYTSASDSDRLFTSVDSDRLCTSVEH